MTASGEESLYDLLGVDRTASKGEIRRAYHRLAVVCHPDRHPEDEHAQERYDALQHIKACLLDDERRAIYDETGIIDEEDGFDASQFEGEPFRALFEWFGEAERAVEADEVLVDEFEVEYRGSVDELADLVAFYLQFGGRMDGVVDYIPYADDSDLARFRAILDDEISGGRLQPTKAYRAFEPPDGPTTAKVVARAKAKLAAAKRARASALKAAEEAEGPPADVFALIQDRQVPRDKVAVVANSNNNADAVETSKNAKKEGKAAGRGLGSKKSKAKAAA